MSGSGTDAAILRSAATLMAQRGYHGTSMRDIARDVGLQMASLYHHFGAKQDILVQIMRGAMRDLTGVVAAAAEAAGDDPGARLEAAIRAHIRIHTEGRADLAVADSELRALEEPGRREIVALRDAHTAWFRDPIARLGVPSPGIVASGVITMCTDVALWFRPDGPLDADGVADVYVALVLSGIGAR